MFEWGQSAVEDVYFEEYTIVDRSSRKNSNVPYCCLVLYTVLLYS